MRAIHSLTHIVRARKYTLLGICVLLFAMLAIVVYLHTRQVSYASEYAAYASLAKETDDAAYAVGSPDNATRSSLNRVLTQVLSVPMKPDARLKLCNDGVTLLLTLNDEIQKIDSSKDAMDTQVAKMQLRAVNGFTSSDTAKQIVKLAKERSSLVSDIRALSYRANFETRSILSHIIDDGGKLTPVYVTELNNEVPALETEFNKRSNLYTRLSAVAAQVDEAFKSDTSIIQ